jgi:flavin reductase (DIM6/NTAB) family NADH-FMN oxidoreductase RutF
VLSPDDFRRGLSHFASGVTVVTTRDAQGRPAGLTASAFTSVSLMPPLILVCVAQNAQSYPALRDSKGFVINILADDQETLSNRFASSKGNSAEKFDGVPHTAGALGFPLLEGAIAHLECSTVHAYPGGDHTIFVGQVEAVQTQDGVEPLLYFRGRYGRVQPPEASP